MVFNLQRKKRLVLLLFILNLIGIFSAWYTYKDTINNFIINSKYYLIPFIPISFILYFLMSISLLYIYYDFEIPSFFGAFSFCMNFTYGFASVLFYVLFMVFVDGFSYYHFWNIFAHGFLGLQSLLIVNYLNKIKIWHFLLILLLFLLKDILDLFYGTFDYFVYHEFGILKIFIFLIVFSLQIASLFFLVKINSIKRFK